MPYVATALAGRPLGGAAPPRRMDSKSDGSMRWSRRVTSEVWVAPPRAAASICSPDGSSTTLSGVPVSTARVITDNPPMCDGGRQASHRCRLGSMSSAALVIWAEATTASRVRIAAFGAATDPELSTTRASPSSTGCPSGSEVLPDPSTMTVGRSAPMACDRVKDPHRGSRMVMASPEESASATSATSCSPSGRSIATRSLTDSKPRFLGVDRMSSASPIACSS